MTVNIKQLLERTMIGANGKCHPGIRDQFCLCTEPGCREDLNCTVERDRYICVCDSQYTGRFCDVNFDPCLSDPCKNGMCIQDSLIGFTCQCQHGFTGVACEQTIDFCTTNSCQNSGICSSLFSNYSCQCHHGFTGKLIFVFIVL